MIKPYIDYLREAILEAEGPIENFEIQVIALSRMCDALAAELNKREEEGEEK